MDKLIIFGAQYLIFVLIFLAGIYFARQSRKQQKEMLAFAIMTLPVIYIMAKFGSWLYFDPRPFVVESFVPLIAHASDNGFPSDHTLLSSAVAMIIFFYNKKLGVMLLALTLLVGFARVLAGVHHTVDILGSVGFAIVFSWLVHKYLLPKILEAKICKKFLN